MGTLSRVAVALFAVFCVAGCALSLDNGLGLVPPMGWNSWNHFGCSPSEEIVKGVADLFVSTGMRDAGYSYVNLDDCVFIGRNATGFLVPDPKTFPSGIAALADYVHSKGLKFGIYSCAGTETCQGRPGLYGYEDKDAEYFASVGVDYLKVDWCHTSGMNPKERYTSIRDALLRVNRPIFYSMCEWGVDKPWEWAMPVGNSWRISGDIKDIWLRVEQIIGDMENLGQYAGPGGWNDPDMLEIGNGGLSQNEEIAHMSLWCLVNAPLLAGNDLSKMSNSTLSILTNKEAIAVNQDPLGQAGSLRRKEGLFGVLQVWTKEMSDNQHAAVLFNKGFVDGEVELKWSDLQHHATQPSQKYLVRDLWLKKDLGVFSGSINLPVDVRSVRMLRLIPAE